MPMPRDRAIVSDTLGSAAAVALLDAGDGRRLERFEARTLDRPAPAATAPRRAPPERWATADLRFESSAGWSGRVPVEPWRVELLGLAMELRPGPAGAIGLFPEHLLSAGWVEARIRDRSPGGTPAVLNLFAHTGLLTLVASRAGAEVVHVDAARAAVSWARHNAGLSGLGDRPIRWIVDDAAAFVAREGRRGRRYDGLILDPPSFGRAGRRRWRLWDDLPSLLAAVRPILAEEAFVLVTTHTTGIDGPSLGDLVARSRGRPGEVLPLRLDAESGAGLDLGWAVRIG